MLDRWLPLLDSSVSRAGAVVGTAIGFVWGFLWSTGRVRQHRGADDTVLYVFSGMPSWTFPRGGVCVGACYLTADNDGPRVLRQPIVSDADGNPVVVTERDQGGEDLFHHPAGHLQPGMVASGRKQGLVLHNDGKNKRRLAPPLR